eukprot:Polyplicarium_translucidae@DN1341_c0_g1_i1.p1
MASRHAAGMELRHDIVRDTTGDNAQCPKPNMQCPKPNMHACDVYQSGCHCDMAERVHSCIWCDVAGPSPRGARECWRPRTSVETWISSSCLCHRPNECVWGQRAAVYVLDDALSAVDAHVGVQCGLGHGAVRSVKRFSADVSAGALPESNRILFLSDKTMIFEGTSPMYSALI